MVCIERLPLCPPSIFDFSRQNFQQQASGIMLRTSEFTSATYVWTKTYKILNEIQPKILLGV